jgi:hypothetical protein
MIKKLILAASLFIATVAAPVGAFADDPDHPPQACGCEWMAVGYSIDGGYVYGWVCHTPPHCIALGE